MAFNKIDDNMTAWLEERSDAPADVDLWGVEKNSYGFVDLEKWLEKKGKSSSESEAAQVEVKPKKREKQGDKKAVKKLAGKGAGSSSSSVKRK